MIEIADVLSHDGLTCVRQADGVALVAANREDRRTATFRVDAQEDRCRLRINRSGVHTLDTIASELAWLIALRHE